MNSEDPNRNPVEAGKTQEFLDRTIQSGVSSSDPEATLAGGDSESAGDTGISRRYRESVGDWIGPYHLMEEIGSGGMGTVYRAEQQEPVKREVALKIIKAGMDTNQVIARFEAERQALSMMEHSGIAKVLDASATENGRPYFVMELVRGVSVTTFCDEQKLTIRGRLKLFCKICDAIQHAHQKGIIHRDLKPSNILVSKQNGRAVPKVIDFGVAKATNQRLTEKTMFTQQGQVVGTLEYMSPEQAQMTDANVDTRTDIYSLGVILYELLTGNTPLNRSTISKLGYIDILNKIKDQEAEKPSSRLTDSTGKLAAIAENRGVEPRRLWHLLRGDLDWIVLKALDKEPGRRYESAAALADDVQHYLHAEPIDARPPTHLYLLGKFARRHKVAVTAGVLVLAVLIAGIVLSTSQLFRAREAEDLAARRLRALQQNVKVEMQNRQLEREIQRKTESARVEMANEIRMLESFGRWQEMVNRFEDYRQQFGEPPLELEILRLYALDGLGLTQQLRKDIIRLEAHPNSSDYAAQLGLLRGYAFLAAGDGETDAKSRIQTAIDSGALSPADELFAKGLINENPHSAIGFYKRALEQSPFHSQARMQLIIAQIMLGRYDEVQQQVKMAQSMFPDDQRFVYAELASHSFADKRIPGFRSRRRGSRNGRDISRELKALVQVSRSVNKQFRLYDRDGMLDWFTILTQVFPLIQESGYRAIPVAEFQKAKMSQAYGELVRNLIFYNSLGFGPERRHRGIVSSCQRAWGIHPDNLFKCFEGWSWFAIKDYENSAKAFEVAANGDGLFPEIRNQGVYGAFLSRKMRFDETEDQSLQDEAMDYLARYVNLEFESHRATTMFEAAAEAGRWDLARKITEKMIIREGGIVVNWSMNLLNEAEAHGNLGLALSVCDEMLLNSPGNGFLKTRRQRIVDKIATQSTQNQNP